MTYLDEILTERRAAVEAKKSERPVVSLQRKACGRADVRDFHGALRTGAPSIVAEFKRASPSAGTIASNADPKRVAAGFERGGASALSVLTEPQRFSGCFEDLRAARSVTSLPVLCKDFVIDAYQVWEAAAEGADAVLLIVAALDDDALREFISLADRIGIAALVEVHDIDEAEHAVAAGAKIIGINNRNLQTFDVDVSTALRVKRALPREVAVVAESGYRTAGEVAACGAAGIDAVLVGESLMRADDPALAVARLRGVVL